MADSDKLSKDDLRALARELDSTGNREVEPEPEALEAPEGDMSSAPDAHLSQEEAEKEYKKQHPEEAKKLDEEKAAESSDTIDEVDGEPKPKDQKDKDRLDKNWKKMQEREAAARALMDEAIRREGRA